jgi:8-oxo-dGTP diphosphatase
MINCQFENGDKVSLRHVTLGAIVIKDNKVLLGKRGTFKNKKILEYGKWGLLGGFFDRDENFEQAIKREVMEESGWTIKNLELFRIVDNPNRPKEDRQNVDFVFLADAIEKVGEHDEEVKELKWFEIDKLPKKEETAFDHGDSLEFYQKYSKEKFKLPVWGDS